MTKEKVLQLAGSQENYSEIFSFTDKRRLTNQKVNICIPLSMTFKPVFLTTIKKTFSFSP